MAKLPVGIFHLPSSPIDPTNPYAAAAVQPTTINQVFSSISKNATKLHSIPTMVRDPPSSICVEGVFMWLLLIWITTGTVALLVLLARCCRSRWKNIGSQDFDWGGLESIRSHEAPPSSGRRSMASVSMATASTNRQSSSTLPPPPPPLPPPAGTSGGQRVSGHYPSSGLRRADSSATERRHVPQRKPTRSRRLQSTQA